MYLSLSSEVNKFVMNVYKPLTKQLSKCRMMHKTLSEPRSELPRRQTSHFTTFAHCKRMKPMTGKIATGKTATNLWPSYFPGGQFRLRAYYNLRKRKLPNSLRQQGQDFERYSPMKNRSGCNWKMTSSSFLLNLHIQS